jgi:hypothetical protein
MRTELVRAGKSVSYVILELCSYGETGDFQVLPRSAVSLQLDSILAGVREDRHQAGIADDVLLARLNGTSVSLYSDGRSVLERVAPCSGSAAWDVYLYLLGKEDGREA